MADTTTVMALPYPEGSDANDVPADMQALAERLDEAPGIESLTTAEIAALAAGLKPAGRVVYNSTTGKLQVSNGTSFVDVDAAALAVANAALPKAGGTMSGAIAMGASKITGLAKGTASGDAVARQQIQAGTTAAAAGGYIDITFSPAFSAAPVMVVSPLYASNPGTPNSTPYTVTSEVTASGARIRGLTMTAGCSWIAVGD